MDVKTISVESVDEVVHAYSHRSGLKAFVIPKKGYTQKFAAVSVAFGSVDNYFIPPGKTQALRVPDGTAHFLEHKLFEQKDGNVMEKFARLGSSPNAYTGFSQTVFLFSCADRFNENFRLLLDYVQNPHFTDESVEKEKGIIEQEIQMYEDSPGWRVFFNLLNALYLEDPVRIDIAGSPESIREIDKEILYECYGSFYHPSNMMVLAVGDVDHLEVFQMVEKGIGKSEPAPEIERIFPAEPPRIGSNYVEQSLSVAVPRFQIGFKDEAPQTYGRESLMREVAVKLLLEMLLGKSSDLYNRLYGEGLINPTFEYDYGIERSCAFSAIGGESWKPPEVRDKIAKAIERVGREGLKTEAFERVRRAMTGRLLRQLNSVEGMAYTFTSVYFRGVSMFDYLDIYDKITFEYVREVFKDHFKPENLALSVIKPIEE